MKVLDLLSPAQQNAVMADRDHERLPLFKCALDCLLASH